jgi:dTDP-4-dehydrorhamnose 3,5-epimerase
MPFEELNIEGVFLHKPFKHKDSRGFLQEQFKLSELEIETGRAFSFSQATLSRSSKGVLRGIHYNSSRTGQAKYVCSPFGAVWDIAVDLRKNSKTYGSWVAEILSSKNGHGLFIPEGVGHAFLALTNRTSVHYLSSREYDPEYEMSVNPLSQSLGIPFAQVMGDFQIEHLIISERDSRAPDFEGPFAKP